VSTTTWQDYLQADEHLLWEGAPRPGIHGKGKIIALAIFGLPFLIVGIGVFASGIGSLLTGKTWGDVWLGVFFITFSIPFAGAGALMVIGQCWAAAEAHRKLRYALSTRAAYIAKSYWTRSIEAYPILKSTATGLEKGRTADTVWFHVHSEKDSDGDRTTTRVGFDNIADGEMVFRLIRSVQTGASA
jgi:hypothetical protein